MHPINQSTIIFLSSDGGGGVSVGVGVGVGFGVVGFISFFPPLPPPPPPLFMTHPYHS